MKFQSSKTAWFTMPYMKNLWFFINKHNVKYIILGTYFWFNLIEIENQTVSTKKAAKKEEPLNLNLAEPDKVKMRTMN